MKIFVTPKNNKLVLSYNTLYGCPEKVWKTGQTSENIFRSNA